MKNIVYSSLLCVFFIFVAGRKPLYAQSDFEIILSNIQKYAWGSLNNISGLDNGVEANLKTLLIDQSRGGARYWADINYSSTSATQWKPMNHLVRVSQFALAYTMPVSKYYKNPELFEAIKKCLEYWQIRKPTSTNWFVYTIAIPKSIGETLVIMRAGDQRLSSELEDNLIKLMTGYSPENQVGANKLDVAIHCIYRGCLTSNLTPLKLGIDQALLVLRQTEGEGLQRDNSFHQHNAQLQVASYGQTFLLGQVKTAYYLKGSTYAVTGSQLKLLTDYVRNTFLKAIRGNVMDFSGLGRKVALPNTGHPMEKNVLSSLIAIDPANKQDYQNAMDRITKVQPPSYGVGKSHAQYWRSDYALHNRPNYTFSVRAVSGRTIRTENVNNENLKGYFLPDGATNIVVNGSEYDGIFPAWDWTRIPGTTTAQLKDIPKINGYYGRGTTGFVGGVSDSTYGAKTYYMKSMGVTAHKSWFFFDDEIVCLGSSISSDREEQINTTVNQSMSEGTIKISRVGKSVEVHVDSATYKNDLKWVLHDSIGYFFPKGGNLTITQRQQTGDWKDLASALPSNVVSKNVFKIWFNHGQKPVDSTYAYIVVPNKITEADMAGYNVANISIMRNDNRIQAVRHNKLRIWQIVFFSPGTFSDGSVTIDVDKACVVQLKNVGDPNVTAHIADPLGSNSKIEMIAELPNIPGMRRISFSLPTSTGYAGSSVSQVINNQSQLIEKGLAPVADTYVSMDAPSSNYGKVTYLHTEKGTNENNHYSFMKFDISSLAYAGQTTNLRLHIKNTEGSVGNTTWELWKVTNDSWSETGLTWTNKPTLSASLGKRLARIGGLVEWDVTDFIKNEYNGDKTVSFALISNGGDDNSGVDFDSRESSQKFYPQIVLVSTQASGARSSFTTEASAELIETEISDETNFGKVWPNPSADKFVVTLPGSSQEPGEVIVTTVSGTVVEQLSNVFDQRLEFGNQLKPGLYVVRVRRGAYVKVFKIIKQ
ncbi:DNRLRE domain-containing protein [Spirosoma aureum]|uniref:DNRLRE domain-containing protein n=1 Tax=Spirosoma aureum TaxID=2692134 RepID=A0A6G9AKX2_9BACT|nr:polysaccharide lyase family 8 super-sandwich domain-containing protein [Spirosoma aureum]QIP12979.1 DNRLRE domain-containing protein [Spirosoma aureum]